MSAVEMLQYYYVQYYHIDTFHVIVLMQFSCSYVNSFCELHKAFYSNALLH